MKNYFETGIKGIIGIIETYDDVEQALYGHSVWEGRTSDNIYKVMEGLLMPYISEWYPIIINSDEDNFCCICDYVLNCDDFNINEFDNYCEKIAEEIRHDKGT